MNAPGSPSSPLQTTYFFSPAVSRTFAHFMPVGNPAPPRPRNPLARITSIRSSGRISARQLRSALKPSWRRYSSRSVGSAPGLPSVARWIWWRRKAHAGPWAMSSARRSIGRPISSLIQRSSQLAAVRPSRRISPFGWKWWSTISPASSGVTLEKNRVGPSGGTISTIGVWWHMPTQPTRLTTAAAPLFSSAMPIAW